MKSLKKQDLENIEESLLYEDIKGNVCPHCDGKGELDAPLSCDCVKCRGSGKLSHNQ